jgi:NitT/TauT family transport system substrate-binding protein
MWSPETEEAEVELGADAIAFSGDGIYREIFNLNTTAQALENPVTRAAIKEFLIAVIDANEAMSEDPLHAQQLVVERMAAYPPAYPLELIQSAWTHHTYVMGKVPDFFDVLVEQEQWMARNQNRSPRDRETLEQLVDYSLLDEIMAERAAGN